MTDENEEDTPFIESPEEMEDDAEKNGLNCFLYAERVCGADCMAYTTHQAGSKYLNLQQGHCVLVVGVERLGRYAGGILSLLKNTKADAGRKPGAPPDPMGG